jgi:hypothetical protein
MISAATATGAEQQLVEDQPFPIRGPFNAQGAQDAWVGLGADGQPPLFVFDLVRATDRGVRRFVVIVRPVGFFEVRTSLRSPKFGSKPP